MSDLFQPTPDIGARDLDKHLDAESIPDLKGYSMGDLRQLIRSTQVPQSFITKSQIRTGSYPNNSITTAKLADLNITTAKLATQSVTAVKLADEVIVSPIRTVWQIMNYDATPTAFLGWFPAVNGAFQALGGSWGLIDIPGILPPLTGFTRQYRYTYQHFYNGVAGTTGASFNITITGQTTSGLFAPGGPANAAYDDPHILGWFADAGFDALPTQYLYGAFLGNYTGAAYSVAVRTLSLQGRYVRV